MTMKAVDWRQPVWDGLHLVCPACRQGRIYQGLWQMNDHCSECGAVFEGEEGEFIGGMMLAYSVTSVLVAAGVLVLAWLVDLSAATHLVIWSIFAAVFLVVCYRNMKGLWLGIVQAMTGLPRK